MSSSALFPPSLIVAVGRSPLTWAFASRDRMLGGGSPPDSPVLSDRISPGQKVVHQLGESAARLTCHKVPGQSPFSGAVELGGIEPP